jgi:hypothetical protein
MEENQSNLVELGNKVVGVIELPTLNVDKYVGMKPKIAKITEHEGSFGFYIKIETEIVGVEEEIKDDNGKPLEIKASRIFGLQQDSNGNIGWGESTKLGMFLKKKGVSHYRDLVGHEVVVISVTSASDGKDYLSFN